MFEPESSEYEHEQYDEAPQQRPEPDIRLVNMFTTCNCATPCEASIILGLFRKAVVSEVNQ